MKKIAMWGIAALIAGFGAGVAMADDAAADPDKPQFTFTGDIRARWEGLNNYDDLTTNDESGDANDDSYSFAPYRVRLGVDAQFSHGVKATIEMQYQDTMGLFQDPVRGATDPVNQQFDPFDYTNVFHGINMHQGFVEMNKLGGSNTNFRIGRQTHELGTGLFLGTNDYYAGTSFDGLRWWWTWEKANLNAFYYKIEENNCLFDPCPGDGGGSSDVDLWGFTGDVHLGQWGDIDVYGLTYGHKFDDEKLYTLGGRWGRMLNSMDEVKAAKCGADWNIEVAFQTGDTGDPAGPKIDLSGNVIEGWFGWNFVHGGSRSRVHAGVWRSSGDEDGLADGKDENFRWLFGDVRMNNRLGDLEFIEFSNGRSLGANLTSLNVGYDVWFVEDRHKLSAAYHLAKDTESAPGAEDGIGFEVDLGYRFKVTKNLKVMANAGMFFPGDAAKLYYGGEDNVLRWSTAIQLHF